MSEAILSQPPGLAPRQGSNLDAKPHASAGIVFTAPLVFGLGHGEEHRHGLGA